MNHYLGNVLTFVRGIAWLWTREAELIPVSGTRRDSVLVWANRVWKRAASVLDRNRPGYPTHANSIVYRDGWRGWYAFVYLLNVGTHVILSGGAVTTWSRAAWDLRGQGSRWGKLLDQAIQAVLGDDHGKQSGPVLWGTTPCEPKVRWAVALAWTAGLALLGWLL